MKLLSYEVQGNARYGAVKDRGVVDLGKRLKHANLRALLEAGALDEAKAAVAANGPDIGLDKISYLPVIPNPGKILAIGVNYAEHAAEGGRAVPQKPLIFTRVAESIVGHDQPILRPRESEQFDYEVELCIVIGKTARRVAAADALSYVAGYCVFNDGSIRDWQRHTSHFTAGKNWYRSGSAGPWLVTTDEIPDPSNLRLWSRLNGTVLQDGTTHDMVFDCKALIAYISTFTPLHPGDLIATGTPSGVGFARTPPIWMKAGDTIETEVEKIGVLRNKVVDEA